MTQTNPLAVARSYIDLWNEADDAGRKARLAESWAVGARYVDPIMSGEGHDSLATMIAGARAHFPGHSFSLRGTPDGHGSFVRFSWSLAPERGEPVAGGTDIVTLDDQGLIASVIGFLDSAPA